MATCWRSGRPSPAAKAKVQSFYQADFRREQGYTEADWLASLPGAVRDCPLQRPAPGRARVQISSGSLTLHWQVLPPRQIALMRMPRLAVHFVFEGVDEAERQSFMKYFDLYTQRGGG